MREEPLSDRSTASAVSGDDATFDLTLRPRDFDEVVGQRALIDNLKVFVKAAAGRKEPLDHVLFCGPPGLGKTSLAHVIAHERGSPRIANRLLRRVRDFAEVEGDGRVTRSVADRALQRLEVDAAGLDAMDRKILVSLIDKFGGGPVGVETLAMATGERADTLEDVYEPYLLMEGYLARTPRGRVATQRAFEHLGRKMPSGLQGSLL